MENNTDLNASLDKEFMTYVSLKNLSQHLALRVTKKTLQIILSQSEEESLYNEKDDRA
jgi:hypothetical protein